MADTVGRTIRRILPLLTPFVTSWVVVSCGGPPREATVPVPAEDALTRAARVLESFDYNVMEVDRGDGVVTGTRSAGQEPDILWRVTVHVTSLEDGAAARYRLESRATRTAEIPDERRRSSSDLPSIRFNRVPPDHLDEILAALADWRR